MKNIRKGAEPQSLRELRTRPGANFKTMGPVAKKEVREALLEEQGHLCCYCMSRCGMLYSVIEHWLPQSRFPDRTLDYDNLVLSCEGGRNRRRPGESAKTLHCDTRKGNAMLKFSPAKHDIEDKFAYAGDGSVRFPGDEEFDRQLNDLLNLNESYLKKHRAAVIDEVVKVLYTIRGDGARAALECLRDTWLARDANGKFKPFCMAAVYYINRKLGSV